MPAVAPEPILDVVRGLSTLASFAIVVNQLKNIYDAFFISECERCRGTGLVTCPHCHGTKSLRARPGYLRTRNLGIVDDPRDSYLCFYCGPPSKYDFNPFAEDDEQKAMQIQENMKLAVANIFPRPFDSQPLAGTVSCPTCCGSPAVHRLTPDFGKALGLEALWDERVATRLGRWHWGGDEGDEGEGSSAGGGGSGGRAATAAAPKKRYFLEYPSGPVQGPIELPAPLPDKAQAPRAASDKDGGGDGGGGGGFKVTKTTSLEDYVLPYASDDDD